MAAVLDVLDPLMAKVGRRWQAAGKAPRAFTEIAAEALREADIHASIETVDVLRHIASVDALPKQHDPHLVFGEPPVTLLRGDGFHLDAYFWVHPSTSIHNHIFCGAFTVLEGTSLHVSYSVDVHQTHADGAILTGRAELERMELLRPGDVTAIRDGLAFVHRVAHLSRPTLSLVLRTSQPPSESHAYTILPPSLAVIGPDQLPEAARRQLEVARMLYRTNHALADELTTELLARADDLQALWILRILFFETFDIERVCRLAQAKAHASWLPALLEALEQARSSLANWDVVRDEGHRLLVAVTSSTDDRQRIVDLIGQYADGQPVPELILTWIEEMTQAGLTGFHTFWLHAEPVLRGLIAGSGVADAVSALATSLGIEVFVAKTVVEQMIGRLRDFPPLRPFLPPISPKKR